MAPQYDISKDQQEIAIENAKRRLALRNQFLKQSSDPFRHASGEGGTVFDAALQRYQALKVTEFERFKANAKTAKIGFLYLLLPLGVTSYLVWKSRTEREAKFRRGEVAYQDRQFKYI